MAQHARKDQQYHAATANRLSDGRVVYLDSQGRWQEELRAAEIADGADAAQALLQRAEAQAARHNDVLEVYLFAVESPAARTPASVREHIRSDGPTVAYLPPK